MLSRRTQGCGKPRSRGHRAANDALQNQCDNGANINYGQDFHSISNRVVAYACNFDGSADYEPCYVTASQQANSIITLGSSQAGHDTDNTYPGCGEYIPGSIQDSITNVAYGYEDFCSSRGSNFCGCGTNSE